MPNIPVCVSSSVASGEPLSSRTPSDIPCTAGWPLIHTGRNVQSPHSPSSSMERTRAHVYTNNAQLFWLWAKMYCNVEQDVKARKSESMQTVSFHLRGGGTDVSLAQVAQDANKPILSVRKKKKSNYIFKRSTYTQC